MDCPKNVSKAIFFPNRLSITVLLLFLKNKFTGSTKLSRRGRLQYVVLLYECLQFARLFNMHYHINIKFALPFWINF